MKKKKTLNTIMKIVVFLSILVMLVDWISVETSVSGIIAFIIGITVNTIVIVTNNKETEST